MNDQGGLTQALQEFFLRNAAAMTSTVAEHVDDGTGHCRVCTVGGQAGRSVWPCSLAKAAGAVHQARKAAS